MEQYTENLYIPIWLYSNDYSIVYATGVKAFTFQSGYIQITYGHYRKESDCLYIPIWLYSNK